MDLATFIFWIVAIILVGSALLVVTQSNIVHSALALIVVFAMASGGPDHLCAGRCRYHLCRHLQPPRGRQSRQRLGPVAGERQQCGAHRPVIIQPHHL